MISQALKAGGELGSVQKNARHSDPKITMVYDKRDDDAQDQVAQLLPDIRGLKE